MRAGFSLVEVIVALTLLAVGLLGVAASAGMAATVLQRAELREEAVVTATEVLDSIASSAAPQAGASQRGLVALQWTVAASDSVLHIELAASYPLGAGVQVERFNTVVLRP